MSEKWAIEFSSETKTDNLNKYSYIVRDDITINKTYKNNYRQNFTNNLSSATCFGFVSHLQAEYTIVVRTMRVYYSALSGFDKISSYIIMEYYKK
jgi:hypothetical protein